MLHEISKQQLCKWNHAPFTIIEPIEIVDIENQHYFVHKFRKNVWSYKFWLSYSFKQEAPTINRLSGEFGQAFRFSWWRNMIKKWQEHYSTWDSTICNNQNHYTHVIPHVLAKRIYLIMFLTPHFIAFVVLKWYLHLRWCLHVGTSMFYRVEW